MHIRITRRLRVFVVSHRDMPALRASIALITIVIAALFNLGVFGLLLVTIIALDTRRFFRQTHSPLKAMMRALRANIETIALFCAATTISFTLYEGAQSSIVASPHLLLSNITIIRGIVSIIAKWKILSDFVYALSNACAHFADGRRTTFSDRCCAAIIIAAVLLAFAAPLSLNKRMPALLTALHGEMVPRLP